MSPFSLQSPCHCHDMAVQEIQVPHTGVRCELQAISVIAYMCVVP